MIRSVFEAVSAEIDEAGGPDAVIEGARMALRLRPDQLEELLARLRDLMGQYPGVDEYLAADPKDADPYALLILLHRRHAPSGPNDPGPSRVDRPRR